LHICVPKGSHQQVFETFRRMG